MDNHKHLIDNQYDQPYTHCVVPPRKLSPRHPFAHGGTVRIQYCACGAVRYVELNGKYRNEGQWHFEEGKD